MRSTTRHRNRETGDLEDGKFVMKSSDTYLYLNQEALPMTAKKIIVHSITSAPTSPLYHASLVSRLQCIRETANIHCNNIIGGCGGGAPKQKIFCGGGADKMSAAAAARRRRGADY